MPKIRFLRDEQYESEGRKQGPSFAEGETVVASEDFAGRWTRRGSAEVVGKGEPPEGLAFARAADKAPAAARAAAPPVVGQVKV